MPSVPPAGPTTDLCGRAVAPVSRSPARGRVKVLPMSGISGPSGSGLSRSADLQRSLESRLKARLAGRGSTLYTLTWKEQVTPSGLRYSALRASVPRTSGTGSTGWPTPQAGTPAQAGYNEAGNTDSARRTVMLLTGHAPPSEAHRMSGWPTPKAEDAESTGFSAKRLAIGKIPDNLHSATKLLTVGWATPHASDHRPGHESRMMDTSRINLNDQSMQAGWATPSTRDYRTPNHRTYAERGGGQKGEQLNNQSAHLIPGAALNGSIAATAKSGLLNPRFSAWLQGIPPEWNECAPNSSRSLRAGRATSAASGVTATRSMLSLPANSSPPILISLLDVERKKHVDRYAMLAALREAYKGEALFRPSSISRLIGCPGSVQLIARSPRDTRKSSIYATEGTIAHQVAQDALTGKRQPEEWVDRIIEVPGPDGGKWVPQHDGKKAGWLVDAEMAEAVGVYIDEVAKRWTPDTLQYVEHALTLGALDPTDPIFAENRGTADAVLADAKRGRLTIVDLKYGKGVMVAGDSPQLKNYALMGLIAFGINGGWREVETVVVQPRATDERQRIKAVSHDPTDLLTDFLGRLGEAMHHSLDPDPPLNPDPTGAWCRWCPAKATCPALQREATDLARDAFATMPPLNARSDLGALPPAVYVGTPDQPQPAATPPKGTIVLPPATVLDPGDIATILQRRPLWEAWITSVEERASSLLEAGVAVPGWKLVRRTGNRRWKDKETAPDALRAMGVNTSAMYTDPELRSPAQIEKLLPKEKKGAIEDLVERPEGALTLVKAEDRRDGIASPLGAIE